MDILSILLSAFITFSIGAVWYGPVFGEMWRKELGISTDVKPDPAQFKKVMATGFMLFVVASCSVWYLIDELETMDAFVRGLVISAGVVSAFLGINYVYESRSLKFFLINASYAVLTISIMALTFGIQNQLAN